ncbi:MAG: hypothetical protein RID23_18190 [Roseovarius sp.]
MTHSKSKRPAAPFGGASELPSAAFSSAQAHEPLAVGAISVLNGLGSDRGRGVDAGTRIAVAGNNAGGGLVVDGTTYMVDGKMMAVSLLKMWPPQTLGQLVRPIFKGGLAPMNRFSPQTRANNPKNVSRVLPRTNEHVNQIAGRVNEDGPD